MTVNYKIFFNFAAMKYYLPLIISVLFMTSCSDAGQYRRSEGAVWRTYYHITYRSSRNLDDSIMAEMQRVNMSLSMFEPTSRLSRINNRITDSTDWRIDSVYTCAARVYKLSNGRFDPTVGPLVELWGFGNSDRSGIPSAEAVDSAMLSVGFSKITLSKSRITAPPGFKLDFGAIAKGFGVDCVADVLRRNGCMDYLVEIGGEIAASGVNPAAEPWKIGIESPREGVNGEIITLTDQCVATSGNYHNYRTAADGSRYGHTIDPLTGYPRDTETLSVTVIAPSCMEADALATACMTMELNEIANLHSKLTGVGLIVITASGITEFPVKCVEPLK